MDHFSPTGLKVLVVDDDPCCLTLLERMLRECKYAVTTCSRATAALTILRERKESFDVVISDVHMPDMDGFKLLELIGLEMGIPVIMMSASGETDAVMKGVVYGACDYLVKPVRIEELRNIWQHVVRRRTKDSAVRDEAPEEWEDFMRSTPTDSSEEADVDLRLLRKKKRPSCDFGGGGGDESVRSIASNKKARVVWSFDLHQQFVKAINHIGIESKLLLVFFDLESSHSKFLVIEAVPKRILEVMNIQGLTRENVASHLQKYRLYLKRLSGVTPEPFPIASFQAYEGATFGGTMQIHHHQRSSSTLPLLRTRSSGSSGGGAPPYNVDTLATLKQLQALQQAAHEKGQAAGFVGGSGAAAAGIRPGLRVEEEDHHHHHPEFGGGDDDEQHHTGSDHEGELSVRLKCDDSLHSSMPASFQGAVFHRHHHHHHQYQI
ncbi:two-component response regulator ORR21 isoform X1 [Selaginella moellendorffii]|uniref:two-component response regulator ORR21 isoform X1 n=1 Tax=Selaginella moellendorffii TaxID=88036 RepID=UPI000D1CB714|nr:two-component response regulator ORR21 isoform X1 [Selaginella moellendorffii]XP_024528571.1 two-component response regulator ORR21 isoform X1 [Selaginella moellendorffii]|eukprot:XP_024528570.1 two-component response regulator ORR21 isoform X1 [Selaginella moellendorffii]